MNGRCILTDTHAVHITMQSFIVINLSLHLSQVLHRLSYYSSYTLREAQMATVANSVQSESPSGKHCGCDLKGATTSATIFRSKTGYEDHILEPKQDIRTHRQIDLNTSHTPKSSKQSSYLLRKTQTTRMPLTINDDEDDDDPSRSDYDASSTSSGSSSSASSSPPLHPPLPPPPPPPPLSSPSHH